MSPPDSVLRAFDLTGTPERLVGGQGESWRIGDVVVKPEGEAWVHQLLAALPESDAVRIQRPVAARDGWFVVAGWSATRWLPGQHEEHRHDDIIRAGVKFHRLLTDVPRPPQLDQRTDPWSYGDRVAWGERSIPDVPALQELAALRRPVDLAQQLMHGDLGGNVLFAAGLPPAVIDFSPYWRQPAWATAIVVVDAMAWGTGDSGLAERWSHLPEWPQLLVRALLFRMTVDVAVGRQQADLKPYRTTVDWLLSRSRG